MMDVKEVLFQWFTIFLIKKPRTLVLIMKLINTKNCLKNYTKQLLEYLKTEKLILHLKAIFGVLIKLIRS